MTSPSGAEQEAELQGSSWAGALLVTLTTCASNHAPMLVSRASTYSLTCEERGNSHPARGTDEGPLPVHEPAPGAWDGLPAAALWTAGARSSCRAVLGTRVLSSIPGPTHSLMSAAPPAMTTADVPIVPWGQDHPVMLPTGARTAHFSGKAENPDRYVNFRHSKG